MDERVSVLTELPVDWSRPELRELRDLLVLAYPGRDAAEQIAIEAGLVAGTFPLLDDMRSTWRKLIDRLANQGRLRALVEHASTDPVASGYTARFREILAGETAVSATSPLEAVDGWWLGDDRSTRRAAQLHEQRLLERRSRHFDVETASAIVRAARSVGKLAIQFSAAAANGSGFLIGPNLVLTSCHNVDDREHGRATSATIDFDHTQTRRKNRLVRRLTLPPAHADPEHDWAVLELERSVDRASLGLGTPYDVNVDDTVVIIQHPLGAPKQFAIEPLAVRHVDARWIQYLADTQHGSSGSPVFSSRMHVIGLHQGEQSTFVRSRSGVQTVWRNRAVNIDQVTQGLRNRGFQ
ncbi:trypsin-like peptidase domain-containing protein [Amycolatopsis sp. NBC_00438]|uniref:trypsin-like peptidase domain-containing protein n=1 Tax=Amycolatopsis sp. NBC_00438 TaxID=2903558 RepID=UPI002E1A3D1D